MSGGAYQYAYGYVKDMAEDTRVMWSNDARRRAFAKHLLLVAKAMKELEWDDSGDGGNWAEAIDACISHACILEAEREGLERAIEAAKETLERFGGKP